MRSPQTRGCALGTILLLRTPRRNGHGSRSNREDGFLLVMSSLADRFSATMSSRQAPQSSTPFEQVDRRIVQLAPELVKIRRHLHTYPELSGAELASTAFVAKRLSAAGISHEAGPDGRGIITAVSKPSAPKAPTIALRADIDALPILEENEVPYRSRNDGVMHACGHDAHSAILLGTLLALKSAGPISVGWRGIFQPSEESGHGAREMVKRGALSGVDAIVALHVDPTIASGKLALTAGPQTAFCQDFEIEVRGRGGHGSVRITRLIQSPSRRTLYPYLSGRSPKDGCP